MAELTVGRIVHYQDDPAEEGISGYGDHLAALVVSLTGPSDDCDGEANLAVFVGGLNDRNEATVSIESRTVSIHERTHNHGQVGQWHWPERSEA